MSSGAMSLSFNSIAFLPDTSDRRNLRLLPTRVGSICSKERESLSTPSICMPPLCAKALSPNVWLIVRYGHVRDFRNFNFRIDQLVEAAADAVISAFELKAGYDDRQIGVAAALADAHERALNVAGACFDGHDGISDSAAGIIVTVYTDARVREFLTDGLYDLVYTKRKHAAIGVAQG